MKENKTKKLRINKSEIFVKIIAGILALLMVVSVCITLVYYLHTYYLG